MYVVCLVCVRICPSLYSQCSPSSPSLQFAFLYSSTSCPLSCLQLHSSPPPAALPTEHLPPPSLPPLPPSLPPSLSPSFQSTSWTALFFAVKENRREIVKTLIAAGADIHLKDKVNSTYMYHTCSLVWCYKTPHVMYTAGLLVQFNVCVC